MKAEKIKNTVKAGLVLALSFLLFIGTGAAPATAVRAEALNAYDQTRIEDDLKEVDLSGYPKDESALHCLIDGAGFMEYGYSNDMQLSAQYYGVYFYLYNPSERGISARPRANVVNMAVAYDAAGDPTEYANLDLTVLDHTENHRFYKLRVTDASALLRREKEYAAAHGGERRYDVAGLQVWFEGDRNATDSRPGAATEADREGVSFTYFCTGYAAGCGAGDESTLAIRSQKLDSIKLELKQATYRTGERTAEDGKGQNTVSSVYFSVPDKYVENYGELQIIRAEWYEYKTNYIIVVPPQSLGESVQDSICNNVASVLGHTLQRGEDGRDASVPFEMYEYLGPSDSGIQGLSYNYPKSAQKIDRLDWLFRVDDIEEEIKPETLRQYADNYQGNADDEWIRIGDKRLNANLYAPEVDEGHTRGYNQRTFDARDESQRLNLKMENITSSWDYFRHLFHLTDQNYEKFVVSENIPPIEEITDKHFAGSETEQANRLLVAENQLDRFKSFYNAEKKGKRIYLFRFSVASYEAQAMQYRLVDRPSSGLGVTRVYAARETVYLDFDIIHLGFVKGEQVTIIPTVANPIDIYPPITPPPELLPDHWWEIFWWLLGITGVCLAGVIVTPAIKRAGKRKEE